MQRLVAAGAYRKDSQATGWVGGAVAEVLNLDLTDQTARKRVGVVVRKWFETGALSTELKQDASRKMKPFVVVGRWVDQ